MTLRHARPGAVLIAALLLAACQPTPPPAAEAPAVPAPEAPAPPAAPEAPAVPDAPAIPTAAQLSAHVWTIESSSAVAVGTHYSFLADGTLVIQQGEDPPGVGAWKLEDGALTLTEEGQAYPTDIVSYAPERLELRSHNPGGTVTLVLVPDPTATLPAMKRDGAG